MKKNKKAVKVKTKRTVKRAGATKGGMTLNVPGPLAKAITAKAEGGSAERLAINYLKEKFV